MLVCLHRKSLINIILNIITHYEKACMPTVYNVSWITYNASKRYFVLMDVSMLRMDVF